MSVSIEQNSQENELKIKINGRFDFGIHQDFRKASEQANGSVKSIVVDLQGTDYVDSSALGMLLVLRDKLGENKKAITIVNAKPEVKKIFQIASFDKLFTMV